MRRHSAHRASESWFREAEKNVVLEEARKSPDSPFIYRASPLQNTTASLFQANETTVSSEWNNCFKRMKQLFQAYETAASKRIGLGISLSETESWAFAIGIPYIGFCIGSFYKLVCDGFAAIVPLVLFSWRSGAGYATEHKVGSIK